MSTVTENRRTEKPGSIARSCRASLAASSRRPSRDSAGAYLAAAGLGASCAFQAGDFFQAVPAGHDGYLLAHVLHDWNDDQAIAILRKCREAIPAGGRLLIIEAVLPDGDAPHHGKLMDLLMLTVTGGAERGADQFANMLTHSGFRLAKVHPTTTHQSVIEAVPV
jgi:hypothetical protein